MKKIATYQNRNYYLSFPTEDDFEEICYECEKNIVEPNLRSNDGTLNFNGLTYGSDVLIICKDEHNIVGYNSAVIKLNGIYVNQIGVIPEYKRQGIGKKMMECLIEIAEKVKLPVCAHVRNYNEASLALVESLGFEKNEAESSSKNYFFELDTLKKDNKHQK